MSESTETQEGQVSQSEEKRRSFLVEIAAVVVGGLASLGPLAVGLYAVLSEPFRPRKTPGKFSRGDGGAGGSADEYFVTTMDSLSNDGMPRRFEVIANKFDAWNFVPNQPIGAIYLSKQDASPEGEQSFVDGDGKKWDVVAFHATCPHAGCSVSFEQTASAFLCPCHNSSFNMDGTKRDAEGSHNPSPRPLDRLNVNVVKLALGVVCVDFFDFYTGLSNKIRKA